MEKSEILQFYRHEDSYLKDTSFKLNFYILYSCAFLLIYLFKEIETFTEMLNKDKIFYMVISILILIFLCSAQLYLSILDNKANLNIYNIYLKKELSSIDNENLDKYHKYKRIYVIISKIIEYVTVGFVLIVLFEIGFLFYKLLYFCDLSIYIIT